MSYARFSSKDRHGRPSDVYVFEHVGGFVYCCGCVLSDGGHSTATRSAMIEHLREHQQRGDVVPESAFEGLRMEIEDIGDEVVPDEEES